MTLLPGANVYLLSVAPAGAVDRSGDPTAGTPSWTGRVQGFLERVRLIKDEGGEETVVRQTLLQLFMSDGAPATEVAGPAWSASTILLEDSATAEQTTWTVVGYERKGQGTPADKVRLELDNEKAGS